MKIPSLFTKTPKYHKFNYTPRYYDPKAEEMQERLNRIQREVDAENGQVTEEIPTEYRSRMRGSFRNAQRRSKASNEPNAALIRLGLTLFIALFLFAFLTWGRTAIYSLAIFIPVYIYFKFFRK